MSALFFSVATGLTGYALVLGRRTADGGQHEEHRDVRGAPPRRHTAAYDPEYHASLLESLAQCTEAGLDPLRALEAMLAPAPPHPFGDEVRAALRETRAGATAEEAWRRLAERVPVDDVKLSMALLVQSGRLGAGLSTPLRALAEAIRERAFRAAEKRSLEAPVKLLLPMLGVFASILIVLVGALVLDMAEQGAP